MDDNEIKNLKKEVEHLTVLVKQLSNQVNFLSKKLEQQKYINDQFTNNIRRVSASR